MVKLSLLTFIVCAVLFVLTGQMAHAAVFFDNFNDNTMNTAYWTSFASGSGPSCAETNNRLEITIPGSSRGDSFATGYYSSFYLKGNFDIQVDYILLDWPDGNGVRMGLNCNGASVQRTSYGPGEIVGSPRDWHSYDFGGYGPGVVTSRLAGRLRWTRSGSVWSAYYLGTNGSWSLLGSKANGYDNVHVTLAAWSHDWAFGDQSVRVAFDNFIVNSGNAVPEPSSLLTLSGFCGLGMLEIRRRMQ